jgi:hypothetical protein
MQPAPPGTGVHATSTARVRAGRGAQPAVAHPQSPRRLARRRRTLAVWMNLPHRPFQRAGAAASQGRGVGDAGPCLPVSAASGAPRAPERDRASGLPACAHQGVPFRVQVRPVGHVRLRTFGASEVGMALYLSTCLRPSGCSLTRAHVPVWSCSPTRAWSLTCTCPLARARLPAPFRVLPGRVHPATGVHPRTPVHPPTVLPAFSASAQPSARAACIPPRLSARAACMPPTGIDCRATCSYEFVPGKVTLEERAEAGYEFAGWIGCKSTGAGSHTCEVEVTAATQVTVPRLAGRVRTQGARGKKQWPETRSEEGCREDEAVLAGSR